MAHGGHTKTASFRWQREDGRPGEGYITHDDQVKLLPIGTHRFLTVADLNRIGGRYELIVRPEYQDQVEDTPPERFDSRPSAARWLGKRLERAGVL